MSFWQETSGHWIMVKCFCHLKVDLAKCPSVQLFHAQPVTLPAAHTLIEIQLLDRLADPTQCLIA